MNEYYLWYTDTHLDKVFPWTKYFFIKNIIKQNPKAVFLSGDISNGLCTCFDLKLLATFVKCPIYFVLGNHDYHFSSFNKKHEQIRQLCNKYPNLVWLTQEMPIELDKNSCLIGAEGWYDVSIGNPKYLKFTFDWFMTEDFRKLPSMTERVKAFQALADQSCEHIEFKLKTALAGPHNTIYLMTHFPPWKEATRDEGTFMGEFWLPYNVNVRLGKTIERMMAFSDKKLVVLAGHTHTDCWIHVSKNIECKVNNAKYYDSTRNEEHIFI